MTSLYMFPQLFKSSGQNSPTFLRWSRKKREKRQAIKKLLKKRRKRLLRKAFEEIYFFEDKFQRQEWLLIEKRFLEFSGDLPPPAIVYWFLE